MCCSITRVVSCLAGRRKMFFVNCVWKSAQSQRIGDFADIGCLAVL
jgi:hypothetical protein